MRTTVTFDDDVARLLEDAMHRERRPMKAVINEALRQALSPPTAAEPYRQPVHRSSLRPGIDAARLNQLVDELADDQDLLAGPGG